MCLPYLQEVEEEDVYYLQEGEGQEGRIDHNSVMYVSDLRPTELEPGFEPREESCICNSEILQQDMGAELDPRCGPMPATAQLQ